MTMTHTRALSESGLKVLVPVNESYQKAIYYRSRSVSYEAQWYDDKVATEMERIH